MASTTRIAELPESNLSAPPVNIQNIQQPTFPPIQQQQPVSTQQISNEFYGNISAQPQFPQNTHVGTDENLQYKPINVHPNPYGTPQLTPEGPPLPESSPQRNQTSYSVETIPQQSLPSRDIPMDTSEYQHDVSIKPNHIPSVKLTSDYIRDYEKANEEELKLHRQKQYRQEKAQSTISELQVPILVAVLYFIFQIPIINTLMRKYLSFANLYNEDGNFNIIGLICKSALFGSLFYTLQSIANKISNL